MRTVRAPSDPTLGIVFMAMLVNVIARFSEEITGHPLDPLVRSALDLYVIWSVLRAIR